MSDLAAFIAFVVQDLVALSSDPAVREMHEGGVNDQLVDLAEDLRRGLGQAGQAVAFRVVAGLDVRRLTLDVLGGRGAAYDPVELRAPIARVDGHRLLIDVPEGLQDLPHESKDRIPYIEGANHVPLAQAGQLSLVVSMLELRPAE